MSYGGWVALHRQTLESDFWMIEQPFSYRDAFVHVLIAANWKDGVSHKNGHTIRIHRGQLLTSIRKLGAKFFWDKNKVYKWLEFMAETGMITTENVGFGTVLTIVNYDKYQIVTDKAAHTPADTVTDTVTDRGTDKPAPRYNKENKGDKEEGKENISALAETGPEPAPGTPEWYAAHYDD